MAKHHRKILVTSALPYANGSIHLGHLVEYLQTDIWVRFQKLRGHDCIYICATDAHGTPTMLKAREEKTSPETLVEEMSQEHQQDFADFHIRFDNFYTTHSPENQTLVEGIYRALHAGGHIARRTIRQAYDEKEQMFLPDRFVRGDCPTCGTADQYGDSCENCGATYTPADLKNARSVLSDSPPVERESEHFFFKLADYEDMLTSWVRSGALHPSVSAKLEEWFEAGLQDWDISRDAPYFGFEIPDEPGKYFYVWLDAPVGYMASFRNLCDKRSELDFDAYWKPGSDIELYHFIGKDIIYFHSLFWPAVLQGSGYRIPTAVYAHGFLTVNGQKMSKTRGTFIKGRTYLDCLNPEYLRYYYAAKLGPGIDDIDLNLDDFVNRVNSDVVGKLVNIASRCAGFITKMFEGSLADELPDPALYKDFVDASDKIAEYFEKRRFSHAVREIMSLADRANQYIDEKKPWMLIKEDGRESEVQGICTQGVNLFRVLMIYLKPVLPVIAENAETFLNAGDLCWDDVASPLTGAKIRRFTPLATRVDPKFVEAMVNASREDLAVTQAASTTIQASAPAEISIDEFAKADLRVARIVSAEAVDGADSLLKLTLDVGSHERTVFAGIKAAYTPDELENKYTVIVNNLKPRKMRFGISEGMVLAAGAGGSDIFLLSPDAGAKPGMKIK